MRDYFELQVDGRPLGGAGITEKTVPLKQLNFTQADRLISRRNSQLRDYNSSKKRLEKFESRNRAKLTKPETDAHLTEEYGDKLEELKKAMADNAHDLSGIISKLEDGKENWRLRELNKRWMGWLEKQREFNKYRQDVNDAEAKYVKHNEELKQHFEVLYPPLLQHFSRELAGGFMIDIDLFRSNSVQSLDKTVKVEVIRRKTDGVR